MRESLMMVCVRRTRKEATALSTQELFFSLVMVCSAANAVGLAQIRL
jgi:hypothetical protein